MLPPALTRGAQFAALAGMFIWLQTTSVFAAALPPKPNAAEAAFIADVTKTLQTKYSTARSAIAAGYYQMTKLESDGTAVYSNNRWDHVSKYEPNFLWYDKKGKLVGLDYEYPVSSYPKPPGKEVYPAEAIRWTIIGAHMHFAYTLQDGTIKRRGAELLPKLHGAKPTAGQLRQAKLLPPHAKLVWLELHPKAWDLGFWLVPNPNGAFADLNPLVKP